MQNYWLCISRAVRAAFSIQNAGVETHTKHREELTLRAVGKCPTDLDLPVIRKLTSSTIIDDSAR